MKGMKTVRYDELTEEQMMAARRRRQREVPKWVDYACSASVENEQC